MSDSQTRRGRLAISVPDLHRLLNLPHDVEITRIGTLPGLDVVQIEVRGEGLPWVDTYTEPRVVIVETKKDVADGVYAHYDRHALKYGENTFRKAAQ